jgi:hypothetical protein
MRSFALRGLSWTTSFLFVVSNMADGGALDLHAIATLANYERATSDPRFRHYRLREMSDARGEFRTIRLNGCQASSMGEVQYPFVGSPLRRGLGPRARWTSPATSAAPRPLRRSRE